MITATTAREVGITTDHRMRQSPAPSMRAASMRSCAVSMKNPRITMMLNTDTALGRISDQ
ncbi:hypothetical protein HD596_009897 [Nonomuraea jabiensis]|uniref:Uncharacterized protein n=1 Tax=Nonomuraea jabiensis TaxID=882448 RepID=A0A7W9GGG4_9ACTN|nr:hypothetical protein [Nonomuraea jabiensis]